MPSIIIMTITKKIIVEIVIFVSISLNRNRYYMSISQTPKLYSLSARRDKLGILYYVYKSIPTVILGFRVRLINKSNFSRNALRFQKTMRYANIFYY